MSGSVAVSGFQAADIPCKVCCTSGGPIMLLGAKTPYLMGIQIAQDEVDGQRRLKAVNAFAFFEFLAGWVRHAKEQAAANVRGEEKA